MHSIPHPDARCLPPPPPAVPPCAAANSTWWNVRSSKGTTGTTGLPPCIFGPLLNFFGYW